MSTVTPKLNLVKPTTLEQYALSVFNNNMDLLDAAAVEIDVANSVANWTNFSFLNSVFIRARIGNVGFVIADVHALVDVAAATPTNIQTGDNYGNVIPAGYRPKRTQNYFNSIQSGAGRGDVVQCALDTAGNWYIRSNTGSAFTTTATAIIRSYCVYEWDGNL